MGIDKSPVKITAIEVIAVILLFIAFVVGLPLAYKLITHQ